MRKLFSILKDTLQSGQDAVLVSVVASSGSAPRGAGAHMLVTRKGRVRGTVGGGAVEHECIQRALGVLDSKNSHLEQFRLRPNQAADLGMVCGGDISVFFRYISSGDEQMIDLAIRAIRMFDQDRKCWLAMDLSKEGKGQMYLYEEGDLPKKVQVAVCAKARSEPQESPAKYYLEKLVQGSKVYIFGGGHVAQEAVPTLARVNFDCIVLEDREDFAKPELFPGARRTRLVDMEHLEEVCRDITSDDYICVMTRGHQHDFLVEKQILRTPASYIGVIGSRKKKEAVFAKLRQEGYTDQDLARIKTPMRLDIQAETPAEIAVSIAAEMIMERARRNHIERPNEGGKEPCV